MIKDNANIPVHVGIILDGNRRWAREQGRPSLMGHRAGLDNIKTIARAAFEKGVQIMTVFAFSTENWHRDQKEVAYLMKLFSSLIKSQTAELARHGIRVKFFGRLADFNQEMRTEMKKTERLTKGGGVGQLNICLSYGGRDEIVRALRKMVRSGVKARDISEETISANLDTAGLADPDLIIRTSGEKRLSGFLAWQSVYSELYFTPKYWPSFTPRDLGVALKHYAKRRRRFGAG